MTLVPKISQTAWYRGCGDPSDKDSSSAGTAGPGLQPAPSHRPWHCRFREGARRPRCSRQPPPRTCEEALLVARAVVGAVAFGQCLQGLPGPLQLPRGQQPARRLQQQRRAPGARVSVSRGSPGAWSPSSTAPRPRPRLFLASKRRCPETLNFKPEQTFTRGGGGPPTPAGEPRPAFDPHRGPGQGVLGWVLPWRSLGTAGCQPWGTAQPPSGTQPPGLGGVLTTSRQPAEPGSW